MNREKMRAVLQAGRDSYKSHKDFYQGWDPGDRKRYEAMTEKVKQTGTKGYNMSHDDIDLVVEMHKKYGLLSRPWTGNSIFVTITRN